MAKLADSFFSLTTSVALVLLTASAAFAQTKHVECQAESDGRKLTVVKFEESFHKTFIVSSDDGDISMFANYNKTTKSIYLRIMRKFQSGSNTGVESSYEFSKNVNPELTFTESFTQADGNIGGAISTLRCQLD